VHVKLEWHLDVHKRSAFRHLQRFVVHFCVHVQWKNPWPPDEEDAIALERSVVLFSAGTCSGVKKDEWVGWNWFRAYSWGKTLFSSKLVKFFIYIHNRGHYIREIGFWAINSWDRKKYTCSRQHWWETKNESQNNLIKNIDYLSPLAFSFLEYVTFLPL
jgi:hypothetical protein